MVTFWELEGRGRSDLILGGMVGGGVWTWT